MPRHGETIIGNLEQLAMLIRSERESLLSRWREQVRGLSSAQHLDAPTLNDHLPQLIEELACALEARSDETIPEALDATSPPIHGLQRVEDGYDIEEVVAEYNILRGCIHDLAEAGGLTLQGEPFHILNRVLDGAIGLAVQTFAAGKAQAVRQRREEYLTFVAHDLRTPLNAISLAASVLERGAMASHTGEANEQIMKTLRRNVQHLDALVDKVIEENSGLLLEIGLQSRLQRRVFDLWPLVEALIRDLEPLASNAGTRLISRVPAALVVYADAGLLRRVFENVIANAIAYTPRGEVVIDAHEGGPEAEVECRVSDNGEGIPQERLERVFDKLETDPEKDGGLGLGLAIVRTLVEAHGGRVGIVSRMGQGTTVSFTLPQQTSTGADAAGDGTCARHSVAEGRPASGDL
ncbi:MAG TPA: HAMP domain-containing sensor histidine kinase [Burkholderiales bacterium]|nr:HAMP domain-containing sensor histidine kinase [Burkholderiales bacterium]